MKITRKGQTEMPEEAMTDIMQTIEFMEKVCQGRRSLRFTCQMAKITPMGDMTSEDSGEEEEEEEVEE